MTEQEEPSPEATEKPSLQQENQAQATEESIQVTESQPTQEQYVCSVCGKSVVPIPVKTDRGIRYQCPECKKFMKPLTKEDLEERGIEYKGIAPSSVEARKFIVAELLARLDTVYGIAPKKVKPIATTVEDNPQIALNPTALYWHIKQLAGQANDYQLYLFISGLFNKLREKGLLRQPTPMPVMGMPQQQQTQQPYPFMFPQQQSMQQPFSPFMPFQQTRQPRLPRTTEEFEDFSERKTRAKRREERAQEEHELRMAKIRKEIESMTKPKTEPSNIVTIVEPMRDSEGKLIKDDKGNIVLRKITGPREQVRGSTSEDEIVKFQRYKNLFKPDLDESKIREIIREERPKEPESKPLTEEKVKDVAQEAALSVVAVTKKKDEEERRHKEVLDAINRSGGSRVVEGYKSDSYRYMGQATEHLASAIEKKEPIKVIMDGARGLMGTAPPEKTVEAEAKEGIFKRVKKEFVAEE